jgi:hypothetical protein
MARPRGSLKKNNQTGSMRRLPRYLTFFLLLVGTPLLALPLVSSGGRHAIEQIALLQLYVFVGIATYIVGRGMAWYAGWSRFAPPLITTGAVWAVIALFVLTFPAVQHRPAAAAAAWPWFAATVMMLAIVAGLMAWRYWNTRLSSLPLYRRGAFLWLLVAGVFVLTNLADNGRGAGFALGYNVLAFTGVGWLVLTGIDRGERRIVDLGFVLLAALLFARYAELWAWFGPVYFFALGGAVFLILFVLIERARRRALSHLDAAKRAKR